ncbi:MAG: metallophosphoesterase, partial [Verrucomicrobia bacterium]|nr:metallophosphoesterase [Verrucomicrobiota bacterium]
YVETRDREMAARPEAKNHLNAPILSDHLWKAFLPAGIAAGTHPIQVEATDAYGRLWKDDKVLRVR